GTLRVALPEIVSAPLAVALSTSTRVVVTVLDAENSEVSPVVRLVAVAFTSELAGIADTGALNDACPLPSVVALSDPRKVAPWKAGPLAGLAKNSRRKVVLAVL